MNYTHNSHRATYTQAQCSGVFPNLSVQDGLHERCSTRYCTDSRYLYLQESVNKNGVRISPFYIADSGGGSYAVVYSVAEKMNSSKCVDKFTRLDSFFFCTQFLT